MGAKLPQVALDSLARVKEAKRRAAEKIRASKEKQNLGSAEVGDKYAQAQDVSGRDRECVK